MSVDGGQGAVASSSSHSLQFADAFARFLSRQEKVDEEGPQPLELEVQIVALRRKDGGASGEQG
jgi:hypothetical protein